MPADSLQVMIRLSGSNFLRLGGTLASLFAISLAQPAGAAERQVLSGHVPRGVAESQAVEDLPRSTHLRLAIGMPLRNQEELKVLLQQLSDRNSPNYRHYLTPEQFAERFGPSASDYNSLIRFAESKGFVVTGTHPNRTILDVDGAVEDVENAFHLRMKNYRHPSRGIFFAADREPSIDLDIAVQDISGLDNFRPPRPMSLNTAPVAQAKTIVTGSGPAGLFIGGDFRAAYAPGVTLDGTGQTVGLLEFDGFFVSDEQANFAQAGQTPVPTQTVLLDGFNGAPGSSNIEVILDIMMASYMAPGLSKVIVYEGETPNDILNRMATDNLAKQLSSSWGFWPINSTTEQIFLQYQAQGQSYLQASGDGGAYSHGVMPPSDDPSVTVVGGSSLTTSGAGGPWQSEATWSGSGGGVSTTYPIPAYQQGLSMAANGGSTKMRNLPDVALTGDIQMFLIQSNGQAVSVGGTSAATPLWAGFAALANQQVAANGGSSLGFLNPLLYTIGAGSNYQTDFHDIALGNNSGFSAVAGYDLATGWGSPAGQSLINDLTGVPNASAFTIAVSPKTISMGTGTTVTASIAVTPLNGFSGTLSFTASGLPSGVTAQFGSATASSPGTLTLTAGSTAAAGNSTVTVTGTSGSSQTTATFALSVGTPTFSLSASPSTLSIPGGGSGSSTVTVMPRLGFNAGVSLAVSGLPSGVTASFNPSNARTASTLTLSASSSASPGPATLTVNGTSGSLTSTATLKIAVTAPSYSLSASSNNMKLSQGSSGTTAITVGPQNGFSGNVTLTASGLPSGVTASFSPTSTAGTSTLTLSASNTAVSGNATVTVTGTSGSLKATTTISLAVLIPSYTLTAGPVSLKLPQGSSGKVTVSVGAQNGFSGRVALAASGLPSGVTASFSPPTTTGTSTLTLTASSAQTANTAMVTVTGTSGSLKATATVALTIVVPSYTLTSTTSSLNIQRGKSSTATIAVGPQNGFSGNVTLAASGLPHGVTAMFSPSSTATVSTLTLTASSNVAAGNATVTITGTSGILKTTMSLPVSVIVPDFSISESGASLTVPLGNSGTTAVTIGAQNGFAGPVALTLSGLPSGVTAAFSPSTTTVSSVLTVSANTAVKAGISTLTITGTSGAFSHTSTISLTVTAPIAGTAPVNLASVANVMAIANDGSSFPPTSLDGGQNGVGAAYAESLLGSQQTVKGTVFFFGPANAPDAASGSRIPLPSGHFPMIRFLATAVNGSQTSQKFVVTYTDGSTATFTQNLSDWFAPQSFPGESPGLTLAYRDTSAGLRDNRTFYLYSYAFALNNAKQVSSIALPGNRNVVVLAMTLTQN